MFITFEGIEGSGKGTLLKALQQWLTSCELPFLCTREPGGSKLGRTLRELLLDTRQDVAPEAELFLYLADRAQHMQEVILPALAQGKLVLSDRFADSTIVYQGYGRGFDASQLKLLNDMAVGDHWPDLTILIDVDPEIGLARARRRNSELGIDVKEGRFEAESLAFHSRIRAGYLAWAQLNLQRFAIVDGGYSPEHVFLAAKEIIAEALGLSIK